MFFAKPRTRRGNFVWEPVVYYRADLMHYGKLRYKIVAHNCYGEDNPATLHNSNCDYAWLEPNFGHGASIGEEVFASKADAERASFRKRRRYR